MTQSELYALHGKQINRNGLGMFLTRSMSVPPELAASLIAKADEAVNSSADGVIPDSREQIALHAVNAALDLCFELPEATNG